ncbi:hypothetical protein HDU97_006884, partial [Phlyctochytrium planicorne]
ASSEFVHDPGHALEAQSVARIAATLGKWSDWYIGQRRLSDLPLTGRVEKLHSFLVSKSNPSPHQSEEDSGFEAHLMRFSCDSKATPRKK